MLLDAIVRKDIPLLKRFLSELSVKEINGSIFPHNYTALHLAAGNGSVEVVAEFLKKEIDLNIRGEDGYTPIMVAAWACNFEVVKLMLEDPRVDLDYVDKLGRTIEDLVGEKIKPNHDPIVQLGMEVLKRVIKVERANKDRIRRRMFLMSTNRMLCDSIRRNDLEGVIHALELGTFDDLNQQDMNGFTPLHWACIKNRKDIVKLLLQNDNIDIYAVDEEGIIPIVRAAWLCSNDCLKLFLEDDRVDILIMEEALTASIGKAVGCTKEQISETTVMVSDEIRRRKTMAEKIKKSRGTSDKDPKNENVTVKVCLFHQQRREYLGQLEGDK